MIRFITSATITPFGVLKESNSQSNAVSLALIPGLSTASFERGRDGLTEVVTLTLALNGSTGLPDELSHDLSVVVTFDNGDTLIIGTSDVPARFSVNLTDVMRAECTYTIVK